MIETLNKTDFIVSWFAKKYNKTIFRVGNLNEDGCRVWETDGKKIYVLLGYSIRDIQHVLTLRSLTKERLVNGGLNIIIAIIGAVIILLSTLDIICL